MRKNFRIRETSYLNGKKTAYVVEIQEVKWSLFGLKTKWVTYIRAGVEGAWLFSSYNFALNELILHIRRDVISNKDI